MLFLPLLPGAVPTLCPMPPGLLLAGGDPHMAPESHPPRLLLHLLLSIPAGIIIQKSQYSFKREPISTLPQQRSAHAGHTQKAEKRRSNPGKFLNGKPKPAPPQ